MHAVVRTYSGKGAKELADLLEKAQVRCRKRHAQREGPSELYDATHSRWMLFCFPMQ